MTKKEFVLEDDENGIVLRISKIYDKANISINDDAHCEGSEVSLELKDIDMVINMLKDIKNEIKEEQKSYDI